MAELPIPGFTPIPSPINPHWNKAQMDDTGRWLIVRVLKPRKWILFDFNYQSIIVNSVLGARIGVFNTRREAMAFVANTRAVKPLFEPLFINVAINDVLIPTTPAPVWTP